MIEAANQLPGAPRRVLSMKDFKSELPGAVLKPALQKTTWPYQVPDKDKIEIPPMIASHEPHQHTIIEEHMKSWRPVIDGATEVEIDRLLNIIHSLQLKHALVRRAELEALQDKCERDATDAHNEWQRVSAKIKALIARGVQP